MYQIFPIFRTTTVEVLIPASAGAIVKFEQNQLLTDAIIFSVQTWDANALIKTPDGNPVIPTLAGVALTLVQKVNTEEIINFYPMYSLADYNTGGIVKELAPFPLVIEKCTIKVLNSASYSGSQYACLQFSYAKNMDEYKKCIQLMKDISNGSVFLR